MSAEVLTLRDLDAPPSTAVAVKPDAAPVTIKSAVLALCKPLETDMRALAEKYRDVAYDLATPKGLKAAKDARLELRESGRFAVQRLRDRTKDQLNDGKKILEAEAERLIAIVKPVEDHVHAQVEAREKVLADEKAERDRIEAERKKRHTDAIAVIAGYVAQAAGQPPTKLRAGIAYVETVDVSGLEEFVSEAEDTKNRTLLTLRALLARAEQEEADTAERERQRVENARVAAELAEQKRLLDEQAATLKRQAEEIEAARQRAITPAAPVATEGKADTPEPGTLEAAPNAPADEGNVPLPAAAGAYASSEAQAAQVSPSGDEGTAAHAEERAAEPASSPKHIVLVIESDDPDIDALLADCVDFLQFVSAPFSGRFPTQPKPSPAWWASVRERIEHLQPLLEQAITARETA